LTAKQKAKTNGNAHPSGDERYATIDKAMKRFKFEKDALLEVLNVAQESFGYLSEDLLLYVSHQLSVPMSQVYGVSTFYHMFTFEPLGEHNCIVCTGTACHVKGSAQIVEILSDRFNINPGETTPDGKFSLRTARCLGSCGIAPIVVLNGKVCGKVTPKTMLSDVEGILEGEVENPSKVETS